MHQNILTISFRWQIGFLIGKGCGNAIYIEIMCFNFYIGLDSDASGIEIFGKYFSTRKPF